MTGRDALRRAVGVAARRFVAGPALADALAVERRLRERGLRTAIGYWDAAGETPEAVDEQGRAAVAALAGCEGVQLSVKAPRHSAGGLVALAASTVPLHFDALAPETADAVLEAAVTARGGLTLPGRWRRSPDDADRAVQLGLPVRVVKGQWADPDEPGLDPRAGLAAVVDRLAGRAPHVAVATHDAALAEQALMALQRAGTPCELQLLYGLPPDRPLAVARRLGVPVRAYVPYGHGYLPYALSSLKGDPRLLLLVVQRLCRRTWLAP